MQIILLLATLPSTYAAAVKPAGVATVSGVVEVPIYAGLGAADPFDYVEATVGDTKLLLRLATGHRELRLGAAALTRLGVTASGPEGKQTAKVPALQIGGANFSGLTVHVGGPTGMGVDGEIGLPGFDGLAFAVLPSSGTLKLATGGDGAALVAGVGSAVAFGSADKDVKVKVGTEHELLVASTATVPASWSGVAVGAALELESPTTWLAREVEGADWYTVSATGGKTPHPPVTLPAAPSSQDGEVAVEWREVSIGDAVVATHVARRGQGPVAAFAVNASLGMDTLGGLDFALDPTSGAFSARAGGATKKADYSAAYEARLRAALDPKDPAADAEAKKAARSAGLGAVAAFLESRGRFDDAIAARKEIAEADPDVCTSWTGLGATLVAAGHAAEAVEPLTRATGLYQPWADMPLEERESLGKRYAAAKERAQEWTGSQPQDHACHLAPGLLALAQIQAGNAPAVAMIYPAELDLDATLPLAAGNAALLQGQLDAAQAAYRQALKLRGGNNDSARVGLYLAMAPRDFGAARAQLERLRLRVDGKPDPLLVQLYIDGVRAAQGAGGVKAALDALLAADPGDASLLARRSIESAAAGDTAAAASDWAAAKTRFEAELAANPVDADTWANWASTLAAASKPVEARQAAEQAIKLAPGSGMAWLAMADAATAAGDSAAATQSRTKAGMLWTEHPGYALLLAP